MYIRDGWVSRDRTQRSSQDETVGHGPSAHRQHTGKYTCRNDHAEGMARIHNAIGVSIVREQARYRESDDSSCNHRDSHLGETTSVDTNNE